MKKIISQKDHNLIYPADIQWNDLIVAKYNNTLYGDPNIVVRISKNHRSVLVLIHLPSLNRQDHLTFRTFKDLFLHYCEIYDFYLLDDWKEIKDFIE